MDYLIYSTEEEAETAQSIIFEFGKSLAANLGYYVNDGIHGMKKGVSDASTGVTTRWDMPKKRLDDKWIVVHPKYHSSAQDESLLLALLGELGVTVTETKQESWFPVEEVV